MRIIKDINKIHLSGSVVTTGNFDGVHLGHRFLLKQLVAKAHEMDVPAVVVMFSWVRRSSCAKALRRWVRRVSAWSRMAAMRRCSGSDGNGTG